MELGGEDRRGPQNVGLAGVSGKEKARDALTLAGEPAVAGTTAARPLVAVSTVAGPAAARSAGAGPTGGADGWGRRVGPT
ncbi:MAG: hypothetical protein CMJ84_17305, partial [Planctomycetes bacterium]|nr:hypothetical protein [Planctomycetota bacterium]